jgi:deazaflavin-dependent oxidoreductase (nitroreductase family)
MSLTGQVLRVHEAIYKGTDGRLGHNMIGVPCLLLRTTGRKSGQLRTNSLVYARDGDDYIVVGSVGGGPNNPGWIHNLRANPEAEIQVGRERKKVRARELGKDDSDYARLWKIANDGNKGRYDEYQKKTSRVIPVVALTPTA